MFAKVDYQRVGKEGSASLRYSFDHLGTQTCNRCGEDIRPWTRRGITREEWTAKARRYGLRSDALYCSNACRQAAYRVRQSP